MICIFYILKFKSNFMVFEKYIDEIALLIENNIERLSLKIRPKKIRYSMSTENLFELTYEEYERLSEIVKEISQVLSLENKFPRKFIFDKLVKDVIIKSYDYSSTNSEIKSNLKIRFHEFEKILNEEIGDWTYFIPIMGIDIEKIINLGEMSLYPFKSFEKEFLDYLENVKKLSVDDDKYKILHDECMDLKNYCFVKLTVNGTKETSRDKALSKTNELLSIFSLYKPHDFTTFRIMGEISPSNSEIITYSFNEDRFNVAMRITKNVRRLNLSESIDHMKKYYLEYLVSLVDKKDLCHVEKCLLNSIQWYYESVQTETDYDIEVVEATLKSGDYYEHYSYFKLGIKLINLVSALESLLIFNNKTKMETRKERFNLIMNYNNEQEYDYSNDLKELYDFRNDIVHSNKLEKILQTNIEKHTNLLNMFIIKFVEVILDFKDSDKSLDSTEDLIKFYTGQNRVN